MSNSETTETGGGVRADGGENDVFRQTILAVNELYETRENYYPLNPLDKVSKLQKQSTSALQLIDSIPPENRKLPMQRSTYEYLRGKILDALPQYKKEAEDHLSKAVKLNPSLGDAWLSLGNCIWKKGDLVEAKNCMVLALSKGPNKKILGQLSMLERKMAQESGDQQELLKESIKHAKEALAMDVKHGSSWYNLGNAYMYSFFVNGAWNLKELQQSLKAYQNAEKDIKMRYNPDLCFNSAQVNRYLENYERALSGFEAAALKDPSLNANEEIRKMIDHFDKVSQVVSDILVLKANYDIAKQIPDFGESQSMIATLGPALDAVELKPPYKRATIDVLQKGVNKGFAIVAKVLNLMLNEIPTPLFYLLIDKDCKPYVLTVYGSDAHAHAIQVDDIVTILDPCYQHQDFTWNGTRYQYDSLRVDFLEQLRVNGRVLPPSKFAPPSIFAQHTH